MKKNDAKQLAENLLKKINGIPVNDAINDGCDNADAQQNSSFSRVVDSLDSIHSAAARIDIDSIPSEELNELWANSWSKNANAHLPEEIVNHDIKYLNGIIARCSYWGVNESDHKKTS